MFDSIKGPATKVAMLGVTAGLTVGGVALAQGTSSHTKHAGNQRPAPPAGQSARGGRGGPQGGPPGGPMNQDLTYAEMHVQQNGKEVVIRVDRGSIVSASASSITVKENDGSQVTTALDSNTKVLAGPNSNVTAADLKSGEEVVVCGPEGSAAAQIMVVPAKGQAPSGQGQSGQSGAPSGQSGAPSGQSKGQAPSGPGQTAPGGGQQPPSGNGPQSAAPSGS